MPNSNTHRNSGAQRVRINVGGTLFETFQSTLNALPGTRLGNLTPESQEYDKNRDEYFYDRNPHVFSLVIDTYRSGILHVPQSVCGESIRTEMEFWGLSTELINPCCWRSFYTTEEEKEAIDQMCEFYCENKFRGSMEYRGTWKSKLWMLLQEPSSSIFALAWGVLMICLVSASALIFACESMTLFRVPFEEKEAAVKLLARHARGHINSTNQKLIDEYTTKVHPGLFYADIACNIVITLDLVMRMLTCPRIRVFLKSILNLADIVCVVAFWTVVVIQINLEHVTDDSIHYLLYVAEFLLTLKVFRLLRLYKYIPSLHIMSLALNASKSGLAALGASLVIIVFVFATLLYLAEMEEDNDFDNIFIAMWWAIITVTTVGYGDMYPTTTQGHLVGTACAICGVLVLSMPIAIVATNFNSFYSHHRYAEKHMKRANARRMTPGHTVYAIGKDNSSSNSTIQLHDVMHDVTEIDTEKCGKLHAVKEFDRVKSENGDSHRF